MQPSIKFIASVSLAASLLAPLAASATGASFGGRVVAMVPCLSPLGPSVWLTIVPASFYPVTSFIWTPLTITYLAGPITHIGQQVLGVADTPFSCFVGKVPFFGQRIQLMGTSAI